MTSIVDGLRLDSLQIKISGKISMRPPRRFTEVTHEVSIGSPEGDEAIRSLARKAAHDCYVTNTLKRSCTVTGVIVHNGTKIDEHQ